MSESIGEMPQEGGDVPPPPRALRRPELVSPAGDWECARAAVENGADAIYFALEKFNARLRADNFTAADLPRLMDYLHRRGVRGYACLNTLVFEDELVEAAACLRALVEAGVDGVLVQDVGMARLVRRLSPDFPLHASTQMTVTSAAGVAFARRLGCNRVVLARELSLTEIGKIQAAEREGASGPHPMPLEVFVHGALCVAYSGQCLTSAALGGRSANRGECAQACRLPYELVADGRVVPLGDRRYLLSPQDLAGIELLPELMQAGVEALKIEGRLKSPEYVANITRLYRKALDSIVPPGIPAALGTRPDGEPAKRFVLRPAERYAMEMAFSRGLYTGWLQGVNNQALVHGRFGKKRGVYLGRVTRVLPDAVHVRLAGPLKPGDGVVFDGGRPEQEEAGGRVYEIRAPSRTPSDGSALPESSPAPTRSPRVGKDGFWPEAGKHPFGPRTGSEHSASDLREVELRFGRGDVDFSRVQVGDRVWKTDDPELNRRLRQSFRGDAPRFQRPVMFDVAGAPGHPLVLTARADGGHTATVHSRMALVAADQQPLTDERWGAHLGRLGGTPFRLGSLRNRLQGAVMLPVSELNRLRREVVGLLEEQCARPRRWTVTAADESWLRHPADAAPSRSPVPAGEAELIVLVRSLAQLEAALQAGVTTLYCDFENPKRYRDAVALVRAARGPGRAQDESVSAAGGRLAAPSVWVAPPRICKPGEEWILHQVRAAGADGYLVRNYDHLEFFANERRIGDYSLNIANHLAAEYFKNQFGLERLTASYDLNGDRLEALLRAAPPAWFEVTIHQHMPLFHMEHCVFCAFLSTGRDYRDCGRPCDTRTVHLRDRVGAMHPLKADAGCRNTVYYARAQTGAREVARLQRLGVRHFRLEFLDETPGDVTRTIAGYRRLMRGEIPGAQLARDFHLLAQLGVPVGPRGG